ncbi:uncharacterized protein EI90DRAFT_3031350 [Cantharellus anzutake]|uniref:uncharacterized protein n=1 Tax=Cantharellus anzutake TaxID=1750568 RepID=UPI00190747D3|nr:uncharacterized protein EI90DRAFT_3031350 [Cantharellus anzutake]KAF8343099.1 hypothetical protein EI90DRAFT_3031350 [Cantharellus anzutake]
MSIGYCLASPFLTLPLVTFGVVSGAAQDVDYARFLGKRISLRSPIHRSSGSLRSCSSHIRRVFPACCSRGFF